VGVLTLAVLAGAFFARGTYAYWNVSDAIPSATITAGSASLQVTGGSALSFSNLYPGQTVTSLFTIRNNGTIDLPLSVSGLTAPTPANDPGAIASALTVRVDVVGTTGTCSPLPGAAGWSSILSTATPPTVAAPASLTTTLTVGSSTNLCLSVTLSNSAANSMQSRTATGFVVSIGGAQQ
jgi:hypothetical protein